METEKKPNDTTSTEEKENPLLQVPEIETVEPEPKKDRSNEVYTEGKGENDMIAVPKKLDNIKKIWFWSNQSRSLSKELWMEYKASSWTLSSSNRTDWENEKSLMDFAHSYKNMGLIVQDNNDIIRSHQCMKTGWIALITFKYTYQVELVLS